MQRRHYRLNLSGAFRHANRFAHDRAALTHQELFYGGFERPFMLGVQRPHSIHQEIDYLRAAL